MRPRDRLTCWLLGHEWTNASSEGIAVPDRLRPLAGDSAGEVYYKFRTYAAMWCQRCGHDRPAWARKEEA
jgi:hypothetical protein